MNRVVLITGGGRGIGAATARAFGQNGDRVVITSRTAHGLKQVAQSLPKTRHLAVRADISREVDVRRLFATVQKRFGRVDVLVNNAGLAEVQPWPKVPTAHWHRVLQTNLTGAFFCAREAYGRFLKQRGGGCILNLSSLAGIAGAQKFVGFSAYSVAKHGVVGLTECLAEEGRPHGIRAICVAPGAVNTAMLKKAVPHLRSDTQPEDIARILVFLADPAQKALSGTTVQIHSNT